MKLSFVILFVSLFAVQGFPQEENLPKPKFYSHMTTSARTIEVERLAFETFPGANNLSPFLYNNLSLGVSRNAQIGVVPAFYLFSFTNHRFNGNFKWNFYDEEGLVFSFGVSHFSLLASDSTGTQKKEIIENDGSVTKNPYLSWTFYSLSSNYFFPESKFSAGLLTSYVVLNTNSAYIQSYADSKGVLPEWAVDLSYAFKPNFYLTSGIGQQRVFLFDVFESERPLSYGITSTFLANRKWLSRVSIGIQLKPEIRRWHFVTSFDI